MTTVAVPELSTERLRLRAPRREDFARAEAFMLSDRAALSGGPHTPRSAWWAFAGSIGSWLLHGFGYWAVEERATGALVGAVGVGQPPWYPEPELGWDLYEGCEGRGFATEAARAARDWALGPRGLPSLVSHIDPANPRSLRVAERLGGAIDPDAPRPDPEDVIWRHALPEAA